MICVKDLSAVVFRILKSDGNVVFITAYGNMQGTVYTNVADVYEFDGSKFGVNQNLMTFSATGDRTEGHKVILTFSSTADGKFFSRIVNMGDWEVTVTALSGDDIPDMLDVSVDFSMGYSTPQKRSIKLVKDSLKTLEIEGKINKAPQEGDSIKLADYMKINGDITDVSLDKEGGSTNDKIKFTKRIEWRNSTMKKMDMPAASFVKLQRVVKIVKANDDYYFGIENMLDRGSGLQEVYGHKIALFTSDGVQFTEIVELDQICTQFTAASNYNWHMLALGCHTGADYKIQFVSILTDPKTIPTYKIVGGPIVSNRIDEIKISKFGPKNMILAQHNQFYDYAELFKITTGGTSI